MPKESSGDANHPLPRDGLVPIRTVASLTGVNPVTLRAWERRYSLVTPVRTAKGHRLYTVADIDFIQQVTALLEAGMSIGQVRQVLRPGRPDQGLEPEEQNQHQKNDIWSSYQRRMIEAIVRFDESGLDELYNEILSLYPVDVVTSKLIVPLLRELGWRWEQTAGSVAEEHFFVVYLRNKLGARFHHMRRNSLGPKLFVACLPGEQHEVGVLLFALAALDRDFRVILLGANMPLAEVPMVVRRAECQAVVLSGSIAISLKEMRGDLSKLVSRSDSPVFFGGQLATRFAEELASTGVVVLGEDLNLALRTINATLGR